MIYYRSLLIRLWYHYTTNFDHCVLLQLVKILFKY